MLHDVAERLLVVLLSFHSAKRIVKKKSQVQQMKMARLGTSCNHVCYVGRFLRTLVVLGSFVFQIKLKRDSACSNTEPILWAELLINGFHRWFSQTSNPLSSQTSQFGESCMHNSVVGLTDNLLSTYHKRTNTSLTSDNHGVRW
jgi:hypothetical protein